MSWIHRVRTLRDREIRQRVAYHEVVAAFHDDPIAGYGLFELLCDSHLLSAKSQKALEPYVRNVDQRLALRDKEWKICLPMKFEPITDREYDTLTFVIAEALRELHHDLTSAHDDILMAQLRGINNTLRRHSHQTASISNEIDVAHLTRMLIRRCGVKKKYNRADRTVAINSGDYFEVTTLLQSPRYFDKQYIAERNLEEDDVVTITEAWSNGYAAGRRQTKRSHYSQAWHIQQLGRSIPQENDIVIVHASEGDFRAVRSYFVNPVKEFASLLKLHDEDNSLDPHRYQPDADGLAL